MNKNFEKILDEKTLTCYKENQSIYYNWNLKSIDTILRHEEVNEETEIKVNIFTEKKI